MFAFGERALASRLVFSELYSSLIGLLFQVLFLDSAPHPKDLAESIFETQP